MPIPSHTCTFSARDLAVRFAGPLTGVLVLALTTHLAAFWNRLPSPVPADLDRTLLAAKAHLAQSSAPVDLLLLGDSSCMMNVDTPALNRLSGRTALNLGTFSHLDLSSHAALLRDCLRHRPAPPGDIVLLVHPISLWRGQSDPDPDRFLRAQLRRDAQASQSTPRNPIEMVLAGVPIRERLIQPWLPVVLRGDFATAYGTTWHIQRTLRLQAGSLADPTRFDPEAMRGRHEFRLGKGLETQSREFAALIPEGSRLWIGLTPVPESLTEPGQPEQIRALLSTWSAWLPQARVLRHLPAVLPDSRFATATHLNLVGIREYTQLLATELRTTPGEIRK